jgi:hypothetical protein
MQCNIRTYFPRVTYNFVCITQPFPILPSPASILTILLSVCFFIFHIHEIIQRLYFCTWLISLTKSSKFIWAVVNHRISSFCGWIVLYCVYIPHFLLSVLDTCFHIFFIVTNASVSMGVQISLDMFISFSLSMYSVVGLLDYMDYFFNCPYISIF